MIYNRAGRVVRQAWNNSDTLYTFEYDPEGNVIEMKIYEGGRPFSITRYDYEFDFEHNWIRQKPSHFLNALPDMGYVADDPVTREIAFH